MLCLFCRSSESRRTSSPSLMASSSGRLEKEVERLQNLKSSLLIVQLRQEVRDLGGDPDSADPQTQEKPALEARQPSTSTASSGSETPQPKRKKRAKKRSPPQSAAAKMKEGQVWAASMMAEMESIHQRYEGTPAGTPWEPTEDGHFDALEVRKAAKELKELQREQQQQRSPPPPLPTGWKQFVDKGSGDLYYHHKDGTVTWDRPTPSASQSSESEESEEDAKSGPDSPIRQTLPPTLTPQASPVGNLEPKGGQAKGRGKGKKGGKAPRGAKTKSTAICKFQNRRGGCQNGPNCRYVHNETWVECYFWKTHGRCRKGDRCPMAHRQTEEKSEPPPRMRLLGDSEDQEDSPSYHKTPSEADSSDKVEAVASPELPRQGLVLSAAAVVPPVFFPPPGEPPATTPAEGTSNASSIIMNTIMQGMEEEEPVCWQAPLSPRETVQEATASKRPPTKIKQEVKEEQ